MIDSSLHSRASPFSLMRQISDTSVSSFRIDDLLLSSHEKIAEVPPEVPARNSTNSKSVRFVEEEQNIYHENTVANRQEDNQDRLKSTWYSKAEIKAFRNQSKMLINTVTFLENRLGNQESWLRTLLRAHDGFCCAQTVDDVQQVITACQGVVRPAIIGLERQAVPILAADRKGRRKQLLTKIAQLQESALPAAELEQRLYVESRAITRTSRLLAHHIAQQSIQSD